jgi:competence protein CoiA
MLKKFIHRTNFKKYDFERVSYIEKYSHQLFETVTVDDKLQINIQKQIYKFTNLLIQKNV